MRKISFVWSCFVMTFFVACQQAEVENPKADDLRMSIVASINGQSESPESRYTGTDPSNVIFKAGDNIGLFVDDTPAEEWIYDAGCWNPVGGIVYWPNKDEHIFRAFYPYASGASLESVPMPILSGQKGTIESISARDFLVATKAQSYGEDGEVTFSKEAEGKDYSFKHVSTLLKITFKGGGDLKGSTLTSLKITGANVAAKSTYSFTDKAITIQPDDKEDDELSVSLGREVGDGDEVVYVIVNEKQLGVGEEKPSNVMLAVEYITTDDKTYVASVDNFANSLFAGGKCQSYTFTIKDSSLIISGSEISDWGDGGSIENIVINGEEIPASV